jgi:hypothetical protein
MGSCEHRGGLGDSRFDVLRFVRVEYKKVMWIASEPIDRRQESRWLGREFAGTDRQRDSNLM